jgi:release factor glutamine methyltransferase
MNNDTIKIQSSEFQATILRSVYQHQVPYLIKIKNIDYVMFPDTFNPVYAKASLLLLDNLGVNVGDVVLDPFTGSGADAIFSVIEGASNAVAIDKFTMPFLCTKYNISRLGLDAKIDVRQGDLFDPLDNEKFDLVVANPPFGSIKPNSVMEASVRDADYTTLERFFSEVDKYLKPNGRIRLVFSNVGNMEFLHNLIKENNFKSEVVARDKFATDVIIEVYEIRKINY